MKKKEKDMTPNELKKARRRALIKAIGGSLLMVALGVLLMLYPGFGTKTVASILGWTMIAGGAVLITVSILNWDSLGLPELLIGIAVLAVGIFVVIRPLALVSLFGVIIGVYVGFHGIISVLESLKLKKLGYNFLPNLILGLVMFVLALVLIFVPMSFSHLLMRIVGGFMVVAGLSNLVFRAIASRNLRKPKEKDDDED